MAIQSAAKLFSVDKNSFETTVKCPTCNAVITDALVDYDIATALRTNIVEKDTGTSEKLELSVDYAVM